jgi:glutamate racemase
MLDKNNKQFSIGVFDSGLGGLSVLKQFLVDLNQYSYIYLGDTARLPYGSKSADIIYQYSCEALDFLFKKNCNLVILACNTASALALRKIQQEYLPKNWPGKKVLGVIRPLAEKAASLDYKRIGVLATRATANSQAYLSEIKKLNSKIEVFNQEAPLLVPLIEEGWLKKSCTKKIVKHYLRPLKMKKIDYLILACTHYPFLLPLIKQRVNKNCAVDDPNLIISQSLKKYLDNHPEIILSTDIKQDLQIYLSDKTENFEKIALNFLKQKIVNIKQINLC